MKTATIFAAIGSIMSLGGVSGTCYGSGDDWPDKEQARSFVENACKNTNGMFTGYFQPRQTKSMCPRSGSRNLGLLFEVQNLNANAGFDLGDNDCYERLTNEIFGCGKGGESTVAGWRFKADPGAC
ncbi:hypothetical protein CB0940_06643 [Cercospora beticola]|uniref:Secreted protein n=1 Tax=Cercospora beticola TaxID=122368 RepID=A0A2G5I1M5_CERBT|nr:hypothetical protein CB0940_06643 [Cercospora beticola]PIA98422.1 hypothetical protein CB0940_06643 [Cercospora beticola]WPA99301.1 hypothetical protein RHO25_003918 [Cercospora beticola]CAK1360622.1 unnamed protein product [Cercospora beticola]